MSSVFPAAKYQSAGTVLADGSETVVLAAGIRKFISVTNIRAATDDGSAGALRIVYYKATAATAFTLVHDAVIPANDALNIEFMPLALGAGDELRVTGAASTHVVVTYLDDSRGNT
jgi:hypothetical protein